MITLEEAKQYLRVDFPDDDDLISAFISTAQTLCMDVARMEDAGASKEELAAYLGKGRARKGIFEGDIDEGEIEIGQICSMVKEIETVEQIMKSLV